jgi:hypothetical protein
MMTKENQRSTFALLGKLAVVAGGGYLLWQNRFKVQRFLEANGISTPWMNGSVGDAVMSGGAKIAGSIENEVKTFSKPSSMSNNKEFNKPLHN